VRDKPHGCPVRWCPARWPDSGHSEFLSCRSHRCNVTASSGQAFPNARVSSCHPPDVSRALPGEKVVAFVDDDPGLRGRRLNGIRVAGGTTTLETALDRTRPDIVFVTIPNAPKERLDEIVQACAAREIDCRFVRREVDVDPRVILGVDR